MRIWSRLANLFRGDRLNREIDEELRAHLDEAVAQGRDPEEARRALGSPLRLREQSRDVRVAAWIDALRADVRFGWRQLMRNKATSAAAVLSLALGIGACTSAFRLIDALLLRPLPVEGADRLYAVAFAGYGAEGRLQEWDSSSYPMFERMRSAVQDRAEATAVSYAERVDLTYGSDEELEKAERQYVSGRMFAMLGLRPALGRLLTADDDGAPGAHPVAVLSYDYWTQRFGQDRGVLGRTFRMDDRIYQIVGVAAGPFTGTETGTVTGIFVPMAMKDPQTLASANTFWLRTLLKLRLGVDAAPIREQLRAVFHAIQEERAKGFTTVSKQELAQFFQEKMLLEPAAAGRSNLQRDYRRPLTTLGILTALVLLIACANVANLMTARAAAREREMALRVSIGAGRWRLVQLVLVESAWLAFLATGLAAAFAWRAAPAIIGTIDSPDNPARLMLPADWRVLTFMLAMALGVTMLFGLIPALRASAIQPANALKGGENPHAHRRLMHALIAAQVAFCFVVHFVAGLFVTSFDRLANQPLGFSAERILNLETVTRGTQPAAHWNEVAERLKSLPGVERVALTTWPVMSGESAEMLIARSGTPSEVLSDFLSISPGWFDTMRIPVIDGRDLRPEDPRAVVVNQAFARQYFDGRNPVGQWFDSVEDGGRVHMQIVGLVRDARSRDNPRRAIRPTVYVARSADARGTFVVRTASANPLALASTLRREVPCARTEFRVTNIRTQQEIVRANTVRERLLATLAMFFAAVALLLAGVGLYGVLDYSVLQRRREIGIRMAIGARASEIARRVSADVFAMVLAGAVVGLAPGLGAARYVESLLFEVRATDIGVLAVPPLVILAAALVAAAPAVVRAVRIDPASTLRNE